MTTNLIRTYFIRVCGLAFSHSTFLNSKTEFSLGSGPIVSEAKAKRLCFSFLLLFYSVHDKFWCGNEAEMNMKCTYMLQKKSPLKSSLALGHKGYIIMNREFNMRLFLCLIPFQS